VTGTHPTRAGAGLRLDWLRAAVLVLLVVILWCTVYDRWTAASWEIPLSYTESPEKGDAIALAAAIKAATEGPIWPTFLTNIPALEAPFQANWDAYPVTEKPLLYGTRLLAGLLGLFAGLNLAVMIGQVLAALAFYLAARLMGIAWHWALAGALIFAFAHFAFAQGLHHLSVSYYWHVPLCFLVAGWMMRGEGLQVGDRKFLFALAVGLITGVQNVYYTNLFCQFILIGGLVQAWRQGWRRAVPAALVLITTATAFFLMNLNTLVYDLIYGTNPQAVVREYRWLEIYGLKLVDLMVPPPDHIFPPCAAWGAHHLREAYLSFGESPPSGYLGVMGLGAAAWLVIVSLRAGVEKRSLPLEAWLILWIIIYAGVGGLNSWLGTLDWQLFRATTRYSICILCLVLLFALRDLSRARWSRPLSSYAAALLVTLIALADQIPPWVSAQKLNATAQAVASDRRFVADMEAHLPPHAMVFQLPIMPFPEGGLPGIPIYDQFRPYLYSHDLRFSFGGIKGTPKADWQWDLRRLSFPEAVHRLELYGFSASLVNMLKQMGRGTTLENDQGNLICILLQPVSPPILPDMP
jgi:phosphoglycerol transferase